MIATAFAGIVMVEEGDVGFVTVAPTHAAKRWPAGAASAVIATTIPAA